MSTLATFAAYREPYTQNASSKRRDQLFAAFRV